MADVLLDAYKTTAPTLLDVFLAPVVSKVRTEAEAAGRAWFEAQLPQIEAQAEKTAQQALILVAVALGTGLALWLVFRKKKSRR